MGKAFGEFLKALRADRGLTLRQVQEQVHVSNAYLSQIERGERGVPRLQILQRLAEVYGVPVTELVEAAQRESAGVYTNPESSEPDVAFVSRGYQNLSKANRQHLSSYLQYLLQKQQ